MSDIGGGNSTLDDRFFYIEGTVAIWVALRPPHGGALPDVARGARVLATRARLGHRPYHTEHPSEAHLIIEVAESSLALDCIEVYTGPPGASDVLK